MSGKDYGPKLTILVMLMLVAQACTGFSGAAAVTPSLTPPPPTSTLTPSFTPPPTSTRDLAATQVYEDFYSEVQNYQQMGYISSAQGVYVKLPDFSKNWSQINWYRWENTGQTVTDFVLHAHFTWYTASPTPDYSGCGFVFAIQDNHDHYAVFLDRSRIVFYHEREALGPYSAEVGKTKGSGRVDITGDTLEADFALIVNGHTAYVLVDQQFIGEYTLSEDSPLEGKLAYSVLSGTNNAYGTQCMITKVQLWKFN